MAGSYNHVTDNEGRFLDNNSFVQMIENLGDAYEAVEEMYGMIWFLANGDGWQVELARRGWQEGTRLSPGVGAAIDQEDTDE